MLTGISEICNMKNFLLLFTAILIFTACREKSKVDVISPVLSRVAIDGDDSTVVTLTAGENFTIQIEMTDNMGLNEVQFNIHPAENGHEHEADGYQGGEERLNSGTWYEDGRSDVSGTSAAREFELSVPENIAGNWHLSVNLLDEVGEKAIERVVLIRVINQNLPEISISTIPAMGSEGNISMTEGSDLSLNGQAYDPDGLEFLRLFVINQFGVAEDTTHITIVDNPNTQEFMNLTFDSFPEGEYRVIAEAGDTLGYVRKWDAIIYVTE
jgi:hypothetical protein